MAIYLAFNGAFLVTVVIADDLLALVVIALFYGDSIDVMPLIWAAVLRGRQRDVGRRARVRASSRS